LKSINIACQYFLNYDLEESEVRHHIKMLADAGYECIYAHARQGLITPYFSDKYWEILRAAVDECNRRNVQFAIWDEDCYPSGVAGNRIIWEHPELTAQSLHFTVLDITAGKRCYHVLDLPAMVIGCYTVCDGNIKNISGSCGTVRPDVAVRQLTHNTYSETCKIPFPHWRAVWNGRHFAVDYDAVESGKLVVVQKKYHPDSRHSSDLLNPETTRLFLEFTHEAYLQQFGGEMFRNNVASSFLDEPAPEGMFCWTTNFAAEFKKQHAFDLLPYLPHLILDIDDKSIFIRHCYRMTQQRLLTENYLNPIKQWCYEHGIDSVGHLTRSEYMVWANGSAWPNEMKAFSFLDIPCADPLGAGEAWSDARAYHVGLKAVSSAAHIFNKKMAGGDSLAVLGHEASVKDLAFHLDYQIAMGLTYFNIHGLSYSLAGDRKDEAPPSVFYQHSQWEWMKYLLENTGKICRLMNSGKVCTAIGMLYPAATFYCMAGDREALDFEKSLHDLVENLLSHQKDFIFIDEDTVCGMIADKIENFVTEYPYFVIPPIKYLPYKTAAALEDYKNNGGKLLFCGKDLPMLIGDALDQPLKKWYGAAENYCENPVKMLPGPEVSGAGAEDILLTQRIIDGKKCTYFFNRSETDFTGTFDSEVIYLAPGCGTLKFAGQPLPAPLANTEKIENIDRWNITFQDNTLLLSHWNLLGENLEHCEIQLLERNLPVDKNVLWRNITTDFLYSGKISALALRIEKNAIAGGFRCEVNGVEITDFHAVEGSDCCFIEADITHALRSGNAPVLNKIVFFPAEGAVLQEAPFLCGKFKAEFRHAGKTLPFLQGFDGVEKESALQLWSAFGYGNYSGTAVYYSKTDAETSGDFVLDLGNVYDLAEVRVDGKIIDVLYRKPYTTRQFHLERGVHDIEVRVSNGPGNRDRLAGLPSGMTGPVSIFRILR